MFKSNDKKWRLIFSYLSLTFGSLIYAEPAFAADAWEMLNRFAQQAASVQDAVKTFGWVMGAFFFFMTIMKLKTYGEARTAMSSSNASLKAPVAYLIISAIFLNLDAALNVLLSASFGYTNPMGYPSTSSSSMQYITPILIIVQLIGWIAFIRGWMQLLHVASHGSGQNASFGKAFTHIMGGVLAINIGGTIDLLRNSFFP